MQLTKYDTRKSGEPSDTCACEDSSDTDLTGLKIDGFIAPSPHAEIGKDYSYSGYQTIVIGEEQAECVGGNPVEEDYRQDNRSQAVMIRVHNGVVLPKLVPDDPDPNGKPEQDVRHVSMKSFNRANWAFLSYTDGASVTRMQQEIAAVRFDITGGTGIERYAHHHSTETPDEVMACPNDGGTRIIFNSNWKRDGTGAPTDPNYMAAYVIYP